jgi:hypothetical protein
MPSIQTLVGKRFESILQEKYPGLSYVGDIKNRIPDFEHPLFYAEAKVSFFEHGYASHLKQYQIEGFKEFEKTKPVLYLVGFHNFENAMKRLSRLSRVEREKKLAERMNVVLLYVVDNGTITKIWKKRNYICKKGHIRDCTLRESHLRQIVENSGIVVKGGNYFAREYYGVPSSGYSFSLPKFSETKKLGIGYILPSKLEKVVETFM